MKTNPEGEADSLKDLTEALTALGNYLGAAKVVIGRVSDEKQQILDEILEKALGQYERSVSALKRLRHSQPPSRDDWR